MLTLVDEYTRQALVVHVAHKMSAADVLETLYPLLITHGRPHYIRSDNGPEFIAEVFQKFASIYASFHNHFNLQRSLSKRSTLKLNSDAALTE